MLILYSLTKSDSRKDLPSILRTDFLACEVPVGDDVSLSDVRLATDDFRSVNPMRTYSTLMMIIGATNNKNVDT